MVLENTAVQTSDWVKNVDIRHLREEDLSALEWDGEYSQFRAVYLAEYQRAQIGSSILWVADCPSAGIIGQVFIQLCADRKELADGYSRVYMYAFRVKPLFRQAGLGTKILEVVENDLTCRSFSWITLNVAKTNFSARRLYSRLGYRVIAHEPGIWSYRDDAGNLHNVHEPAWRMEKFLTPLS